MAYEPALPWEAYGDEEKDSGGGCKIVDANGFFIAKSGFMGGVDDTANERHRKLIIKSVNNFPKMLEALEAVWAALQADSSIEDETQVAFVMSKEEISKLAYALQEARRDTQTSQS